MCKDPSERVALVDMDGTVADYSGQMKADLARVRSPEEPWFDLWDPKRPDYIRNRMDLIKSQTNWWYKLPKLQLGFAVYEMLQSMGWNIHILTKGPARTTSAWSEKVRWCQKHLSDDVLVTVTQDKGLVYGRVLVDDYPEYMLRWLEWRPRGVGIMPISDTNRGFEHERVIIYDGHNDQEVWEALEIAYNRA